MTALGWVMDQDKRRIQRLEARLEAAEKALDAVGKYMVSKTLADFAAAFEAVQEWKRIPRLRR